MQITRNSSVRCRMLGIVVTLLAAGAARAETVTADFAGVSPGRAVDVSFGGTSFQGIAVGYFNWTNVNPSDTFLGPAFRSFCIEFDLGVLPSTTFTTQPLTPRLSDTTAGRLREFWGENFTKVGDNADAAASFQLGLWEIVHDSSSASLDLSSGNFQALAAPDDVIGTAQGWLNALDGQGTFENGLLILDSSESQDQVTVRAVPVPPGVILGGMGLVGFVGYGVRRRMKKV